MYLAEVLLLLRKALDLEDPDLEAVLRPPSVLHRGQRFPRNIKYELSSPLDIGAKSHQCSQRNTNVQLLLLAGATFVRPIAAKV